MRWLIGCVAAFAVGCALIVQQPGCSGGSSYALLRSIAQGSASIDKYHWSTCDVSWYHRHFYAAKGPGLALASIPLYEVLKRAGVAWDEVPPSDGHFHGVPGKAVWPFTLLTVLLSACALFLLMRLLAERLAPGYGTAAAASIALGTMLLPYSTLYASHVPAAMLGFAAFAVLFVERHGASSWRRLALAGGLSGLAVVVEPQLALVAVILAGYAASRGPVALRLAPYAAGALVGAAPLIAFNQWAFGSIVHQSYNDTVAVAGNTGHDQLGGNVTGFFGMSVPSANVAARLLLVHRGLFVTTPIAAVAVVAVWWLMRRGRWRAEFITIACVIAGYLLYNAAYYLPFGGDSAGPRFLIPVLPFLALPLALAFRRLPVATAGLAVVSVATMVTGTVTQPMLGDDNTRTWFSRAAHGAFADSLLTRAGVGSHALAMLPTLLLFVVALGSAAAGTARPRPGSHDLRAAAAVLVVWAVLASATPPILSSGLPEAASTALALALLALGLAVAAAVAGQLRSSRAASSGATESM